ncbi:hypothetical protein ACHAPJ_006128 [Fusarium lateritium]
MSTSSLSHKVRNIFGRKPVEFGPAHPNSYPVFITDDLINAALPVFTDQKKLWPKDPEFRVMPVMVKVPYKMCPPRMINTMPPDLPGKHPHLVAIALGRFRRTPEHPGGELSGIALSDWNQVSVAFDLEPREILSVFLVGYPKTLS